MFMFKIVLTSRQLHDNRSDGEDDEPLESSPAIRPVADNDLEHESQLLRLFVELLRG